ncbi:TIM barrel protein [Salinifilum aidingensis]
MDPTRFDVNLSVLFTELDLLDRPAAAKAAGFDAIEFWWPFPDPVPSDREVDRFVRAVEDAGVSLVGLNFFAGDMPGGDRGVLSQPARAQEFRDNIDVTVDIGKRLGCRAFNALYGNRVEGVDPAEQDAVATESLVRAAESVGEIDGTVLVEPVSGTPSYPLHTAGDAVAAIERARARGVHNVRLLLDIYHLVVNGDDPSRAVRDHGRHIGHVQIADAPGRNEPGTGSIDFARHFRELDDLGYTGHIGLEYKPSGASTDSFTWIK